jgi:hypothetical protein
MWRIFVKAGQPGWAAIVPFYNIIIWLKIINKPGWWLILLLLPIVNIVFSVWIVNLLAIKFGRGIGFTFGLLLLSFIFYPLLAFKDYEYVDNTGEAVSPEGLSESCRNRLLIWSLGLFCFNIVEWGVITNVIREWWNYNNILSPINILFLIAYFLIGLSTNNKYRTASIVLSNCILFIFFLRDLVPQIKDLFMDSYPYY